MNINWKPTYIPGDLVYNHKGEVIRITSSYLKGTRLFYYKTDEISRSIGCILEEELKPIPLTPEILEKNGWKRNGGQYSFTYKPYAGDRVELIGFFIKMFKDVHDMLKYRYFQITHEDKVIYGCFYVHQLQHHLFGLGINHEMEV